MYMLWYNIYYTLDLDGWELPMFQILLLLLLLLVIVIIILNVLALPF